MIYFYMFLGTYLAMGFFTHVFLCKLLPRKTARPSIKNTFVVCYMYWPLFWICFGLLMLLAKVDREVFKRIVYGYTTQKTEEN